jgi:hypothetical protein
MTCNNMRLKISRLKIFEQIALKFDYIGVKMKYRTKIRNEQFAPIPYFWFDIPYS